AIRHLFSAHGVVVLSRMIRTALLLIFGRLWKPTLAERSPTSSLPSQIGRRRGNFLGRSEMLLLQLAVHKTPTRLATCGAAREAVWMTTDSASDVRLQMQTDSTLRLPRQDEEEKFIRAHGPLAYNAQRAARSLTAHSPQHVYRMVIAIGATPQFLT